MHRPPIGLRRAQRGLRLLCHLGCAVRARGGRVHHAEAVSEEGPERGVEVRRDIPSQSGLETFQFPVLMGNSLLTDSIEVRENWIWISQLDP